ncbi:MAG: carbohydrate kinase family protein [Granulosicoccus sp.]
MIDIWPAEEELSRIQAVDQQGGGSAHNVGIDIRLLDPDMPVAAMGMLGDDEDGRFLQQQADKHGLNTAQLHATRDSATSYTDVLTVASSGKRTFFHYPGANDLLTPAHFDFSGHRSRILHLGLLGVHEKLDAKTEDGENGWTKILKSAKDHGLQTSIEMVSIDDERNRAIALPCLKWLDYLIVNDHEIGSIADVKTLDGSTTLVDQCLIAAKRVLAIGSMKLVTVHYPSGALCVTRDGEQILSQSLPMPQSQVVSSVGAGDAFVAGFLYGLHEDLGLSESLELAHTVAVASLRAVTTTGSVESVAKCREFAQTLRAESV